MRKSIKSRFLVMLVLVVSLCMYSLNFMNISLAADGDDGEVLNFNQIPKNEFEFNQDYLLNVYAENSADKDSDEHPKYRYNVTDEMIKNKSAIPVLTQNNFIDSVDSSDIANLSDFFSMYIEESETTDENLKNDTYVDQNLKEILKKLESELNYKADDIKMSCIVNFASDANKETSEINFTYNYKTTTASELETLAKQVEDNSKLLGFDHYGEYRANYCKIRVNATMPDGAVYSLTIGDSGEYEDNWYMVKTKEADPKPEFKTKLDYTAIIDREDVGGTLTNGTFYPKYSEKKVEKDADVTATITSTTKSDIEKINDVELKTDGTKNSLGWYYVNKSDKTVIAKDYPFDSYDNLTANGMVNEKDLKLTSSDNLTDTQSVSIKWPFRIIDVTQTPTEIKEDTDKVIVTITTNLPMDKNKLPEGWSFTSDDEGKTQHRISKEYLRKDGDKKEEIIVTANGRDDTDETKTKIEWPSKKDDTVSPDPHPQTGATCLGAIALIGIVGVAITRYRKLKK